MSPTTIIAGITAATAAIEALARLVEAFNRDDLSDEEKEAVKQRARRSDEAWDERIAAIRAKQADRQPTSDVDEIALEMDAQATRRDNLLADASARLSAGELTQAEFDAILEAARTDDQP